MTLSNPLCQLADELLIFLHESAEFQPAAHPRVREVLQRAEATTLRLRKRLYQAARRYVLAVVGLSNVGKSTLLNALFQMDLLPQRNGPCTAVPIEFAAGDSISLSVEYMGDFRRWPCPCQDLVEARDALNQLAAGKSDSNQPPIRRIILELPHPLLRAGLILADTPGFGAAQLGEEAGSHERGLQQYLECEVAQVLWVVLGEQGIGGRELQFQKSYFPDLCDDLIVTGCEEWLASDAERFKRRFAPLFRHHWPRFHFVSGLEGTGIPALGDRIQGLADPQGRVRAVAEALRQLAEDVGHWVQEYCRTESRSAEIWRPDSWFRLLGAPPCDGLRDHILTAWG